MRRPFAFDTLFDMLLDFVLQSTCQGEAAEWNDSMSS